MSKDVEMTAGLTELIDLSKRVANAAGQLARVRETDVEIAQTPREEIHRIAGRTLYRIAADHQLPAVALLPTATRACTSAECGCKGRTRDLAMRTGWG